MLLFHQSQLSVRIFYSFFLYARFSALHFVSIIRAQELPPIPIYESLRTYIIHDPYVIFKLNLNICIYHMYTIVLTCWFLKHQNISIMIICSFSVKYWKQVAYCMCLIWRINKIHVLYTLLKILFCSVHGYVSAVRCFFYWLLKWSWWSENFIFI
jgi:hypothetical protein